ncbi:MULTISPECIES: nuclear transport factor 2 family protein [unclassified Pseudomonas]|uniref:nuclear transport factor 2 family protein n=1 Tax=Pseudomonas sp. Ant30-3 TaxID=1488328 RepID=UPI00048C91E2|nr:DUF4440 domain-containing protein [Pseudomonas sp. Ant30-3]
MELIQTLLLLEQRLLAQLTRCNPAEISYLLAEEFIEFGASGSIWNKQQVVEQLPHQSFTPRTISEFEVRSLSENTVLVTYRCQTGSIDQRRPANSLRSSIWQMQREQWKMVFHQGTKIPDGG